VQEKKQERKNIPIVRNTVQWGPRDVVRCRIIIKNCDIYQGVVIEEGEGCDIEKFYARLAENSGRAAWVLLPKPEENLKGMNTLMNQPETGDWRTG
jgi:hypothetical protein